MTDKQKLAAIRELVNHQRGDQALWYDFGNEATGYMQGEMKDLHSKIESFTTDKETRK